MTTTLWILGFILLVAVLLYRQVRLLTFTGWIAVFLGTHSVITWQTGQSPVADYVLWAIFLAAALPFNIAPLRRSLLSRPLFRMFAGVLPEMSETEQAALEAGTVWWDGDLFSGQPDWQRLLDTPRPALSDEEQAFLDGPVEELCRMLDEWHITHELGDMPQEAWEFIKKHKFFAMIIPKEYGGLEFSALAQSEVLIRLASRSPTAASTVSVPNSLGPAELLHKYGTEDQKNHYLPRLASGDEIPCFALTGPKAGSDAGAIPDTGIVCKGTFQGRETVGIRLNWDKRYITLAPAATVLGLAFKLYDPDHLMGDRDEWGITCALIPTDLPGITVGRRHFPLNIPFLNGPTQGEDVFVPLDYIIGGKDMAGHGWRMLIESLSAGRSISLPSNATGGAKLATLTTGAYARVRKQFNLPIGKFEGVEEAIARMGGYLYAMDAVRTMTVGAVDQGEVPSVPSAIVKYHTTEMGRTVGDDAMDIHGGKGIILGPRNYLGRNYQVAPVGITVEGANILTRSMIIFGQGAIRCHPFVLKEMHAIQDGDIKAFDQALWGHIGLTMGNMVRSFVLGATHARYTSVPMKGDTRRYYQHINRYSAAFALMADFAMLTLGGDLKKKEKISARLGDMLSYMYIASSVLKRYEDQGRPEEDLPLVEWACRDMIYKLQEQLHGLLRNFPNRFVARVLRMLTFPTGRTYSAPSDRLGHRVAKLLIAPTGARRRLTDGVYIGEPDMQVRMLEEALPLAVELEDVERSIIKAHRAGEIEGRSEEALRKAALAAGLIDEEQAKKLERLVELTDAVVAVDDFDHRELGTKPADRPGPAWVYDTPSSSEKTA